MAQRAHGAGLLRGTLAIREPACGKSDCNCAKGEKHVPLCFAIFEFVLDLGRDALPI